MTTSNDWLHAVPAGTSAPAPLASSRADLAALGDAAGSTWNEKKEPHDLHAQDAERFLRAASAYAQVAIAGQLGELTDAARAIPAAAGTIAAAMGGTPAGKVAALVAGLRQAAERLADSQDAAAENLSRLAGEAELWRLQAPPPCTPGQGCWPAAGGGLAPPGRRERRARR
jgi:hypothetical protein